MESGLFLEGGAALTAGDLHGPLPSGHPQLLAAGGALEDLILLALLGLSLPGVVLLPQAGGLFQEATILLSPLEQVPGEGTEDVNTHRQDESIVEEGPQAPAGKDEMENPAGNARPQHSGIQLVDAVSPGKQTCKHHSHDGSAPSIGQGQFHYLIYNIGFSRKVNGMGGLFTKR